MISLALSTVQHAWIYGIISLLIFLVFFLLMLRHTYRIQEEDLRTFSRMPLDNEEETSNQEQSN